MLTVLTIQQSQWGLFQFFKALFDKSSNVKAVSKPISVGMDPVKTEYFLNQDDTSEVFELVMGRNPI